MEITKDTNGKNSSKRIAGLIISGVGLVIISSVGVVSFFRELADPGTAFNAGLAILSVGSGLLGISVAEFFKKPQSTQPTKPEYTAGN